jgi:hypothetical protein
LGYYFYFIESTEIIGQICQNLVRRSQRAQIRWDRLIPVLNRWIPEPHVLHPYPDARFAATHPSWKPYA